MDQVAGKSVDNTGKRAFKLVKLLCENLQKFLRRGHKHTNVCKISRLWRAISSKVLNKTLSNLPILLIQGRCFQRRRRIFANLSMSKFEKNRWKVYYNYTFYYTYSCMPNYFKSLSLTIIPKAYETYFKKRSILEKIITQQKIMVNDYSPLVFHDQFHLFN